MRTIISDRIGFMQGRLSPLVGGKIQAFPWDHWEDEFQLAREQGLSMMEWTLDHERIEENPLMTAKGRNKISGLCTNYQMKIPSLTGDFLMQKPFYKSSDQQRDHLFGLFINVVEACGMQGIGKVIFPLVDNGRIENVQQKEILQSYLHQAGVALEKNRVLVCFELDMPADEVDSFMKELPDHLFAVNYDIGNSAAQGFDYRQELKVYGARVRNVHVKDRLLHGGTVPLGEGDADIKGVIHLLESQGYQGNYILQTARSKEGMHVQELCRYRDLIRKYMES